MTVLQWGHQVHSPTHWFPSWTLTPHTEIAVHLFQTPPSIWVPEVAHSTSFIRATIRMFAYVESMYVQLIKGRPTSSTRMSSGELHGAIHMAAEEHTMRKHCLPTQQCLTEVRHYSLQQEKTISPQNPFASKREDPLSCTMEILSIPDKVICPILSPLPTPGLQGLYFGNLFK